MFDTWINLSKKHNEMSIILLENKKDWFCKLANNCLAAADKVLHSVIQDKLQAPYRIENNSMVTILNWTAWTCLYLRSHKRKHSTSHSQWELPLLSFSTSSTDKSHLHFRNTAGKSVSWFYLSKHKASLHLHK